MDESENYSILNLDCDANGTGDVSSASDGGSSSDGGCAPWDGGLGLGHFLVMWLVYFPIILVTIAGNFLAIMAFVSEPAIRRRVANCFIFSLSVADFLVGWSMIFNFVWLLEDKWVLGKGPCLFWLSLDYTLSYASVLAIIMISLDRYRLVTLKLKYLLVQTRRRAVLCICGCWGFCLVLYPVIVVVWSPLTGESIIDYTWDCNVESKDNLYLNLFLILLEFILPLIILSYLNGRLYFTIRQRAKGILMGGEELVSSVSSDVPHTFLNPVCDQASGIFYLDMSRPEATVSLTAVKLSGDGSGGASYSTAIVGSAPPAPSRTGPAAFQRHPAGGGPRHRNRSMMLRQREFHKHRKAAITLSLLVGVYVVCWLPFYVKNTAVAFCDDCIGYYVAEVTDNLLWCNSAINPFLYALLNLKYRKYIFKVFRRLCCMFT